jgi:hypothetical protein
VRGGFPYSERADQQNVSGFVDETPGGEIVGKVALYAGVEGEVEALQRAGLAECGELYPAFDRALLADVKLA